MVPFYGQAAHKRGSVKTWSEGAKMDRLDFELSFQLLLAFFIGDQIHRGPPQCPRLLGHSVNTPLSPLLVRIQLKSGVQGP